MRCLSVETGSMSQQGDEVTRIASSTQADVGLLPATTGFDSGECFVCCLLFVCLRPASFFFSVFLFLGLPRLFSIECHPVRALI
jgi:hypothetical protein